ncbi:hypothetical protein VIGAN_04059300 [Vigna angularis var. angularis]|uniref:Uncharacterized protein n=1 Tax=Vigna angularis var. angularis TaxID=157739 RepID=A0A0S3RS66_PHAAN|nr:hypothetical protein VIGAN_04059300 [Vigna angularis var. angularis]
MLIINKFHCRTHLSVHCKTVKTHNGKPLLIPINRCSVNHTLVLSIAHNFHLVTQLHHKCSFNERHGHPVVIFVLDF